MSKDKKPRLEPETGYEEDYAEDDVIDETESDPTVPTIRYEISF